MNVGELKKLLKKYDDEIKVFSVDSSHDGFYFEVEEKEVFIDESEGYLIICATKPRGTGFPVTAITGNGG